MKSIISIHITNNWLIWLYSAYITIILLYITSTITSTYIEPWMCLPSDPSSIGCDEQGVLLMLGKCYGLGPQWITLYDLPTDLYRI